jgi:hypothetical protein
MKTVVILQPMYLPWLGYFEQIYRSDVFVFYDDVQYEKNSWQNRNKIKTPNGWQWLTVPVSRKNLFGKLIYEVEINNQIPWKRKHLKALQVNYSRSPYFNKYIKYFEKIYSKDWQYLADLNIKLIKTICQILGLKREFIRSRELNIKGEQSERLVKICQSFNADLYFSGQSAKNYLKEDLFFKAGIKVEYQNYKHPQYPQLFGEFIPYLSVIDLLFNCGPKSLKVITSGK